MHRLLAALLSLGLTMNAAWMLASPASFYAAAPGVAETGPLNVHFVRDIGCAYLVAALGFATLAAAGSRARPAALAGAAFLSFHALVHVWDLASGREAAHHLLGDLPALALPALVGLWLSVPRSPARRESPAGGRRRGLVARLAEPRLAAFERDFGYDVTYLRDIARVSGGAFVRFALFSVFAEQREAAPEAAIYAAKIATTLREDCGPCTQLVTTMAERSGMPHAELRGVLEGDPTAMSPDVALGFQFANAALDRDLAESDRLRELIVTRWGERAAVTLSFAVASARVFPTLKYALGHGKACALITLGADLVPASPHAPRAPASPPA